MSENSKQSDVPAEELGDVQGGGGYYAGMWDGDSCDRLRAVQARYTDVVDNRRGFHRWEFGRRLPGLNAHIAQNCPAPGTTPPEPPK